MIDTGHADSLVTGLLFLFVGAGVVFTGMSGRSKAFAWISWALVLICLGVFLEGIDVSVPWQHFVEICFAAWAILVGIALIRAWRRRTTTGGNFL
jgi:hypothetical protein